MASEGKLVAKSAFDGIRPLLRSACPEYVSGWMTDFFLVYICIKGSPTNCGLQVVVMLQVLDGHIRQRDNDQAHMDAGLRASRHVSMCMREDAMVWLLVKVLWHLKSNLRNTARRSLALGSGHRPRLGCNCTADMQNCNFQAEDGLYIGKRRLRLYIRS